MTDGPREPGGIFRITTARPVAVTMFFVTLVTFGLQSLNRLPMNLLPDISYPRVTVRADYPGAAPEDVEERVTKRLHEALSVLADLESISSISRAGSVDVTLEFAWGTELSFAIQDIRERLDRTILPLEVQTPIILRYDPTLDPVLSMGITGGQDLMQLRLLAEDRLAPKISTVEGVAAVRVRGGLEKEIQVRLKRDRIASHGLTAADVAARLAAENVNLASGTVLEGDTEYLVRILNEYQHPSEIESTILFRDGNSVVRLSDIATVRTTNKERDVITRINGEESVELLIYKEADANIVELAQAVRDRVLGTASQRVWVDRLRRGAIENPEVAYEALRDETLADAELSAAVARMQEAIRQAMSGGGAPPQGGGQQAEEGEPEAAGEDGDAATAADEGEAPDETANGPTEEEKAAAMAAAMALNERAGERLAALGRARAGVQEMEEAFDYLAADLPSDVSVRLLSDQSRFIEKALEEVRDAGGFGAALAVVVLFLFLRRLGTTLIIGVAIPVSIMVTFVPLHLSATTLNVMSLGGLALGIGMVVDNAIIVLESIARCREQGQSRAAAAVNGVREVSGAATASTLTTVAVFAPIVFVEGIAGQVFRDQALTVVASLLVSLVVALFLVPMMASLAWGSGAGKGALSETFGRYTSRLFRRLSPWSKLWRPKARGKIGRRLMYVMVVIWWPVQILLQLALWAFELVGRVLLTALALTIWLGIGLLWVLAGIFRVILWLPGRAFTLCFDLVQKAYPPFIRGIITTPAQSTLTLVVAGVLLAWTLMTAGGLGSELLPEVHQGEIIGRLTMPVGTPLETTDRVAAMAEGLLTDHPDVAWVATTVGVPRDEVNEPDEGEHTARLGVGLRPSERMEEVEERVMAHLRNHLGDIPELRDVRFERPALFTVRSPLAVEIKGDDLAQLADAASRVEAIMLGIPGLRDVQSSVQPGSPEIMLSFDRDLLSRYGLDARAGRVATTVANLVQGNVATRFTEDEHKIDVRVQMDKDELQSLDDLRRIPADPTGPSSESLGSLATIEVREGPREIRRIWGQRAAVVSAGLAGFDIGRATEQISDRLVDIESQTDLIIDMSGQAKEMQGALDQMITALALAVFLVYVVMASIFESLIQPLIIMVTVPLALFGAVAALWLLDIPLSVVVFIGAIILAGIVVNNAIVLIDACNRRRRIDGMPLEQAVSVACEMRLRPILMTTLTTVLGLLPLTGWLPPPATLLRMLPFLDAAAATGGEGTELRAPMAITVVAGLTMATMLTLVVIPTLYALVERALERRAGNEPA